MQIKKISQITNFPYFSFTKAIDAKNGEYGNGIISNIPFFNKEVYKIEDPIIKVENVHYESRVISKFDFGAFDLYATHFGLASTEQKNAFNCFKSIKKEENKKIIFLGDLNMSPNCDIIKSLKDMFNEVTDYFDNEKATYPSIGAKDKIDYIFVSKDIEILYSETLEIVASDHFPIICDLNF